MLSMAMKTALMHDEDGAHPDEAVTILEGKPWSEDREVVVAAQTQLEI